MKFCACTIVLQCYVSVRDGNKATLPLIMVWCPALRKCTQPILNEKHRKLSISNSDLVLTASQIHESSPFFKLWWFFLKLHLTQWTIDQYTLATLNIVMIVTKILLWTSKQCTCDNCSLFVNQSKQEQLGFKILTKKTKQNNYSQLLHSDNKWITTISLFSLFLWHCYYNLQTEKRIYIVLNFPNNYMANVLISNLEKQSN